MEGLPKRFCVSQGGRERKVWPETRHPLELEAVLKFMGGFYVERHGHGNPDFHNSEYSKEDRTAQRDCQSPVIGSILTYSV